MYAIKEDGSQIQLKQYTPMFQQTCLSGGTNYILIINNTWAEERQKRRRHKPEEDIY